MRSLLFMPFLLLNLVLWGCGGPTPTTRFYTLNQLTTANEVKINTADIKLSIGVGPIILPKLLDRPQIVTRSGGNEIIIAEFDRWAENLDQNFLKFVALQLERQMPGAVSSIYPWPRSRKLDYQVRIEVIRFDSSDDGTARLIGAWSLISGDGQNEIQRKVFNFSKLSKSQEYRHLVSTMASLVKDLTVRITLSLTNRRKNRP